LPAEGPPAGVEQATYQSPVMAPAVTSPSSWSGR
jgi:hypothetical protein